MSSLDFKLVYGEVFVTFWTLQDTKIFLNLF